MFGLSMIKPQQNRHRHRRVAAERVQQDTASDKKKNRHFLATNSKNTANATKAKANASATATSTTLSDKYKNLLLSAKLSSLE